MIKPRTLFLLHEQRQWFWEEPGYLELYLPMVSSGCLGEVRSHSYQRELRWLLQKARQQFTNRLIAHDEIGVIARKELALILDAVMGEFKPDLVVYALTWPTEVIPAKTLNNLKIKYNFKLFSVIWDHDEGNELLTSYDKDVIAVSDLVAVADSYRRANRIRHREGLYADFDNVQAVRFMPMIADPAIFKPSSKKTYDVTVAGSSEGYRQEIYEKLTAAGISVNRIGGLMAGDHYLAHADYARALAESRIVVNTQTRGERIQLKGRVSQVIASGSLLLEQWSIESERFLEDLGLSGIMWKTVDELICMIQYWLDRPVECDSFALKARDYYSIKYNPFIWTNSILIDLKLEPYPEE